MTKFLIMISAVASLAVADVSAMKANESSAATSPDLFQQVVLDSRENEGKVRERISDVPVLLESMSKVESLMDSTINHISKMAESQRPVSWQQCMPLINIELKSFFKLVEDHAEKVGANVIDTLISLRTLYGHSSIMDLFIKSLKEKSNSSSSSSSSSSSNDNENPLTVFNFLSAVLNKEMAGPFWQNRQRELENIARNFEKIYSSWSSAYNQEEDYCKYDQRTLDALAEALSKASFYTAEEKAKVQIAMTGNPWIDDAILEVGFTLVNKFEGDPNEGKVVSTIDRHSKDPYRYKSLSKI